MQPPSRASAMVNSSESASDPSMLPLPLAPPPPPSPPPLVSLSATQGSEISTTPPTDSPIASHLTHGESTASARSFADSASVSTGEVEKTAVLSEAGMYSRAAM